MSLAIVWSYYHSLYELESDLARHFVVIAPNLTVYERLKDDFENCAIFYQDPLLPEDARAANEIAVLPIRESFKQTVQMFRNENITSILNWGC